MWSWGHNYRPDDVLEARDATPRVRRHVERACREFLARSGRERLAEKTPSNCLRLPFLHALFPDAHFVHIYRDGRAVVSSTDIVTRTRRPDAEWYGRRLLGTPVWEWPAFLPRAWRTLGRRLLGREMTYWGPQPKGWRRWLDDPPPVRLAKQWRYTLEPVLSFRESVSSSRWLDLRYEDLVTAPGDHARRIIEFAGLDTSSAFVEHLESECRRDRIDAWRDGLAPDELAQIRPVLEPTLARLGYAW